MAEWMPLFRDTEPLDLCLFERYLQNVIPCEYFLLYGELRVNMGQKHILLR